MHVDSLGTTRIGIACVMAFHLDIDVIAEVDFVSVKFIAIGCYQSLLSKAVGLTAACCL